MFDKLANEDFDRALFKAFWRKIRNWFTGESNELMAYDEVKGRIPIRGQHDVGLVQVDVDQIVGSVGRYRDFDRAFLPTQTHTRNRWINIDKAHYQDIILPPVELFKIGELYFVKDGNHRISVARERGQKFVDAYVTEVAVPGPVYSEKDLDHLVLVEEQNEFFAATHLDVLKPGVNFLTALTGQYPKLLEHIAAHRWYLGEKRGAEVPYEEAVLSWFENVYLPVIDLIRTHELHRSFPNYAELDLYLWIIDYQWHVRKAASIGEDAADEEIIEQMISEQPEQPVRKMVKILMNSDLLDQLVARLDYARFMQQMRLLSLRPGAEMETTVPGAYDKLLEHIDAHRWFLGKNLNHAVNYDEALLSWYDTVYQPIIRIIRDQDILSAFPDRTETDLYLWILERQWALRESQGIEVPVENAASELVDSAGATTKKQKGQQKSEPGEMNDPTVDATGGSNEAENKTDTDQD
ncbi:MAG: hypothetical protein ACK2UW_03565 [Anaerolineales bacterium]